MTFALKIISVLQISFVTCTGSFFAGSENPTADAVPNHPPQTAYVQAFDQLWLEMDRHYSYFELKKIDWLALKAKYRPKAEEAKSAEELIKVLKPMLAELKDDHVRIEGPSGNVFPHPVSWERNWNFKGYRPHMLQGEMVGKYASIGRTKQGFGVLVIENQAAVTPELAEKTVAKIEALKDVSAFLVDLRPATGGNETHVMPLASAFCAKSVVYAKHKYRNGPKHTDFGPVGDRTLPAGKNPFAKPVVVLLGPATMSSGEGLAMMFAALPNVTTMGSRTRGSSGNPLPFKLKDVGISVHFSRWVAMLPDGTPIEGRGVKPRIEANFPPAAFMTRDPVLEQAFDFLKEKTRN